MNILGCKLGQSARSLVETLMSVHPRRPGELTFQIVGPLMIGAYEAPFVATTLVQQRPTMPTDIGQDAHLVVFAPDRDQGLIAELEGHVVAGIWHFLKASNAEPFLAEEMFALEVEDGRIRIIGPWHRPRFVITEPVTLTKRVMYLCKFAGRHWGISVLPTIV